uniref:BMERB domain-containing protein n=1 Tax=Tetraodon nigroviridis TaxID=99883 RepID=H3CET8_TETNG
SSIPDPGCTCPWLRLQRPSGCGTDPERGPPIRLKGWTRKPSPKRQQPTSRGGTPLGAEPVSEQRPHHGFPLIKRKVQTDHNMCPESLQGEVADLDKRLEAMEWHGVELERHLRDCVDEEEEEEMLMEWFTLNHERHVLVRRDMELGYLTMQQKLEERQADVEYELRRLFIKQENEWTEDERGEERQLMDELLSLIDQRNQIICSLDQDVQRERKEDKLLKATLNSKELQKEGLKELRRSKGKLNPSKVFKLLHHRAAASVRQQPDKR